MNTEHMPQGSVAVYLRADGSLMVADAAQALEMRLTPAQLLQLGMDCLKVATQIKPDCLPEVMAILSGTQVAVPVEPQPQERAPCLLN